jgi:uncharacterized SAM-binding protein YcdF (DUF218 family)
MFFFLSKLLNYLAQPLTLVFMVWALAYFIRSFRWKRIFFIGGFGLLYFFSNDFIANECMRAWEVDETPWTSLQKTYTWGIVLTGVTRLDTEPEDRVHFQRGADRVFHTFQLYKKGVIQNILISGGSGRLIGNRKKEADELYDVFLTMGVDSARLKVENESRNTHESAVAIPKLLPTIKPEECLLITSAFHMRRSRACFVKQGLELDTFSADKRTHKRLYTFDVLFIPSVEALSLWQSLLKEWVGMMAYKLAGYI